MTNGLVVQEPARGKLCVCAVWQPVVVGGDPGAGLRLRDAAVAARHLELCAEFDGRLRVRDLGGGVALNGVPVAGEAHAAVGDRLRLTDGPELVVLGVLDAAAPRRERGVLRMPQRIGTRYILLREVGRGAAGAVYEGHDEQRGQRCAIKLLFAGGRAAPQVLERFRREANLQARLRDYPGIVTVHDLGTVPDSGELFCAMDYVTGTTLRERLRAGLPRLEGLRLVARIARAAAYAHDHGLVHRDLKPANVMVSAEGTVRLTDFGLCKALEEDDGLTATGVTLGTPSYMAPEQIDDAKRVGPEADIYALGGILFAALTGQPPFAGQTLSIILDRVVAGDLDAPRGIDPSIPPELEAICLRAMSREPIDRHPSALAFAQDVEAWLRRADPPAPVRLQLPPRQGR